MTSQQSLRLGDCSVMPRKWGWTNSMSDHLAVLQSKYLRLILDGMKTIECRLTRTPKPPFGVLKKGERIYLKESSGEVLAVARAAKTIYREINGPNELASIRRQYGQEIMAQEEFWQARKDCRYCSLIFLRQVRPLSKPFRINKRDMRGWVVLDGRQGFDWRTKGL